MTYLIIIALVATAGIVRLWLAQQRETGRLEGVDSFRTSMQKISPYGNAAHPPARAGAARGRRPVVSSRPDISPLDPARRAAAKRRIEARRAARDRVVRNRIAH